MYSMAYVGAFSEDSQGVTPRHGWALRMPRAGRAERMESFGTEMLSKTEKGFTAAPEKDTEGTPLPPG